MHNSRLPVYVNKVFKNFVHELEMFACFSVAVKTLLFFI